MIRALKLCPDDTAFLVRPSHCAVLASLYHDTGFGNLPRHCVARGSRQDDSVYALRCEAFHTPDAMGHNGKAGCAAGPATMPSLANAVEIDCAWNNSKDMFRARFAAAT